MKSNIFWKNARKGWETIEIRLRRDNCLEIANIYDAILAGPFKTLMNVIYSILMKSVEVDEILHF